MSIQSLSLDRDSLWISGVETSADLHGQKLISALRILGCDMDFVGIGGHYMVKEGLIPLSKADEFSVMGFFEVLGHIPKVIRCYRDIKALLTTGKIKGVILIDAPDFHFKIAKMAHKLSIPVYYYISPQAWAWRPGRVKFLKKFVTKLLCIFPFEEEFFGRYGVDVKYVGHPLIEHMDFKKLDGAEKKKDGLILLPGSRIKEIKGILPIMAKTCEIVENYFSGLKIKIVKAPTIDEAELEKNWNCSVGYKIVPFEDRYEEMASSLVSVVASGTASLECGLLGLPSVVVYKVSWPTYFIGKMLVNTRFISMTNIIMEKKIFPELVQGNFTPENVSRYILTWLKNKDILINKREELLDLRKKFGHKRASHEAASVIFNHLKSLRVL